MFCVFKIRKEEASVVVAVVAALLSLSGSPHSLHIYLSPPASQCTRAVRVSLFFLFRRTGKDETTTRSAAMRVRGIQAQRPAMTKEAATQRPESSDQRRGKGNGSSRSGYVTQIATLIRLPDMLITHGGPRLVSVTPSKAKTQFVRVEGWTCPISASALSARFAFAFAFAFARLPICIK